MSKVLKKIASTMGGKLPSTYLCLDLETTGFKKEDDLIVQTGYCDVVDRKPVYYETIHLNWDGHPHVGRNWLKRKLETVKRQMEDNGRNWHGTSLEVMRKEGKQPETVFEDLLARLVKIRKEGGYLVGHGIWQFDKSRIEFSLREWIGAEWVIKPSEIIDTALIEKAVQSGLMPYDNESAAQFFARVQDASRAGLAFRMDACLEKYDLANIYDVNLTEAHTAGFDALCGHYLIELWRGMTNQ